MTALSVLFDSFDDGAEAGGGPPASAPQSDPAEREAERLASYEAGYRSGWDDGAAAEREAAGKVGAELARNLSDLGFTYHEVRTQLLAEVETLLGELFATLLPATIAAALSRRLIDDLVDVASGALDVPVEIVVSPADAPTVRRLLPAAPTLPVTLVEEPALAEGQAFLRFRGAERHYDFATFGERLRDALLVREPAREEGATDAA